MVPHLFMDRPLNVSELAYFGSAEIQVHPVSRHQLLTLIFPEPYSGFIDAEMPAGGTVATLWHVVNSLRLKRGRKTSIPPYGETAVKQTNNLKAHCHLSKW